MIYQGAMLAVFGMGTVFVFLTLLVLATTLMSRLVLRFAEQTVEDSEQLAGEHTIDARTVAILAAAIHQHQRRMGR